MGVQLSPAGHRYDVVPDTTSRKDLTMSTAPIFRLKLNQLPPTGDLTEWAGPVKDQSNEGSCTGHSNSSLREWGARKYEGKEPILSPQSLYVSELLMEGSFPQDEGAMPRTGCRVLNQKGCCEESVWPYKAGDIQQPNDAQVQNALQWQYGAYHRIVKPEDLVSCVAYSTPWLFTGAFQVYDSFESDQTANTGVMPMPNMSKEELLGGHSILGGLKWDIGATPTLRPQGCGPAIMFQNSWGASWGIGGRFWVELKILSNPNIFTDFWMVHLGRPWVPKPVVS